MASGKAIDTVLTSVAWKPHRTVIVPRREFGGKSFVRLHTFNLHKTYGTWYPSPRFFMIPLEHADQIGRAIIGAAHGKALDGPPAWWEGFQEAYTRRVATEPESSPPPDATSDSTVPS